MSPKKIAARTRETIRNGIQQGKPLMCYAPRRQEGGVWFGCNQEQWIAFADAMLKYSKREWFVFVAPFYATACVDEVEARRIFTKLVDAINSTKATEAYPQVILMHYKEGVHNVLEDHAGRDMNGGMVSYTGKHYLN